MTERGTHLSLQATPWSDAFIIGIPEIDNEHRSLFVGLKDLCGTLESGGRKRVQRILGLIAEHAVEHFGHEERLMRQAGYSGYNWHRQQHQTAKKRGWATSTSSGIRWSIGV
jgi:hemerythrin